MSLKFGTDGVQGVANTVRRNGLTLGRAQRVLGGRLAVGDRS